MLQSILRKSKQNVPFLFKTRQVMFQQSIATQTRNSTTIDNVTLLEQSHIDEAVRVNPSLSGVPTELWYRLHESLLNHGLYTSNFLRIVVGNPSVLRRPTQKTIDSIELWRSCQFGEKLLYLLLTKYPVLLNLTDGHQLRNHFSYLKSWVGTSKNVWKLLMNSPNVMEQSEKRIEDTFKYLKEIMCIDIPEIVKSEALSQPLEEINCRHVFLDRLGLFKPRSPKADPNERSKNPRLYQITDTSEKTFATKICHVTLLEFEVFKELYARERNRKLNATEEAELSDDE